MVCFVILHYKNIEDTLACIASIRAHCQKENYKIVVVDNGTASQTQKDTLVSHCDYALFNATNLGFAKANNLGAKEAIARYHPDYLAIINNDTLLLQDDWIQRIKQCDCEYHFDVLGPFIETKDGSSINPFPAYETKEQVIAALKKAQKLVFIYRHPFLARLLECYMKGKHKWKKPLVLSCATELKTGVALHGCALIFSKQYYERYQDIFYDGTFLYHEEEFLNLRRLKDHLTFVYDPRLTIFHKEEASLQTSFQTNQYQRKVFRNEQIVKSLQLLLAEMEDVDNEKQ